MPQLRWNLPALLLASGCLDFHVDPPKLVPETTSTSETTGPTTTSTPTSTSSTTLAPGNTSTTDIYTDPVETTQVLLSTTSTDVSTTSTNASETSTTETSADSGTTGDPCADCDPENHQETELCNSDCSKSMCGDGKLNIMAGELCDSEEFRDSGVCSYDCKQKLGRLAFVSSKTYNGNLEELHEFSGDNGYHGIDDANMECWELAHKAMSAGELNWMVSKDHTDEPRFLAWLSALSPTFYSQPSDYSGECDLPIFLPDGTKIAESFNDLASNLAHPINVDESGSNIVASTSAWTNTHSNGNMAFFYTDCDEWRFEGEADVDIDPDNGFGVTGEINDDTNLNKQGHWSFSTTASSVALKCSNEAHIYCFEQCPSP